MDKKTRDAAEHPPGAAQSVVEEILRALTGIRYGSVEVTLHDGRVVQIERKQKLRFNDSRS